MMNIELLQRAVNFNGKAMLDLLHPKQKMDLLEALEKENINLTDSLKFAEGTNFLQRRQHLKLCKFLGKNADILFKKLERPVVFPPESKDLYAVPPPIEKFLDMSKEIRRRNFFLNLKCRDFAIAKVLQMYDRGYILHMLSFDGGKSRFIDDVSILLSLPFTEIPDDKVKEIIAGILLRVQVISYDGIAKCPLVTIKASDINPEPKLKLGIIKENDFPLHYKSLKCCTSSDFYSALYGCVGFKNPGAAANLAGCFKLDIKDSYSFTDYLQNKVYHPEEYISFIRSQNALKRANVHFQKGVEHFNEENVSAAFMSLNEALRLFPEHVEALVARGALYGNTGNFVKAVQDFEKALLFEPSHEKCKKNLLQILLELGKIYEEKRDYTAALESYNKVLELDASNEDAQQAVALLEAKKYTQNWIENQNDKAEGASDTNMDNRSIDELLATKEKLTKVLNKRSASPVHGKKKKKRKSSKHKKHRSRHHHKDRSRKDAHRKRRHSESSQSATEIPTVIMPNFQVKPVSQGDGAGTSFTQEDNKTKKSSDKKPTASEIIDREVENILSSKPS